MNKDFPSILSEQHRNSILATTAFSSAMRNGIEVQGIKLAAKDRDRSMFSQMLVLLREAEDSLTDESQRVSFRNSTQMIADIKGKTHTMTVSQLRQILVEYGMIYQSLWSNLRSAMSNNSN